MSAFEIVFFLGMLGLMVYGYFELHPEQKKPWDHPQPHEKEQSYPGEGYDHIRSTALSDKQKMEQLKILKEAGLLTAQEYEEKRKEILREL